MLRGLSPYSPKSFDLVQEFRLEFFMHEDIVNPGFGFTQGQCGGLSCSGTVVSVI